ncbi:uncharacterized protein [Diabrotica undecimpunctata]|uniref:uncharacterized protein n=1 Tax=Diabrotica undecimpunctata TaxID=50387 RepID=UPI003B6385EA
MQCLNKDIKEFVKQDVPCRCGEVNCIKYQKHVRQRIIEICMKLVRVKRNVKAFNLFLKWRLVSLILTGTLSLGGIIVSILVTREAQRIPYVQMFLNGLLILLIGSEVGHQLQIESENFFNNVTECRWYQWDKRNCEMFIMLLLQIQEPLVLTCFTFSAINRETLLRVIRVVHAYITYFESMKKQ